MSLETKTPLGHESADDVRQLGSRWGFFVALGILIIILGAFAIVHSMFATAAAILTLGILLLAGGLVQVVTSFWAGGWRGFFVQLILGILYAIAGTFMVRHPAAAAAVITLALALAYVAGGLIRLVFAVTHRTVGSGWIGLNGIITFVLGLIIWTGWPWDLWVIGLFLGIDLVFVGWSWVMLGLSVRELRSPAV
jgi:uncharacterized membrane protein HdeD (DUF308 family)